MTRVGGCGQQLRRIHPGTILQIDQIAPQFKANTLCEANPVQNLNGPLIKSISTHIVKKPWKDEGGWPQRA